MLNHYIFVNIIISHLQQHLANKKVIELLYNSTTRTRKYAEALELWLVQPTCQVSRFLLSNMDVFRFVDSPGQEHDTEHDHQQTKNDGTDDVHSRSRLSVLVKTKTGNDKTNDG